MELAIGGDVIRCTDTHPFQVKDKGWIEAGKLQPGDLIYDNNWQASPVDYVKIISLTEPVEVYNFEVEDCHTYYVGDGYWLVHNGCGDFKKIDPSNFERRNNLPTGSYHRQVKPKILSKAKPGYKVGKNPDIMLNKTGSIAYQGANGREFQQTGLNISSVLKEIFG